MKQKSRKAYSVNKKIYIISIIMCILAGIVVLSTYIAKNVNNLQNNLSAEVLKSMGYAQVNAGDDNVENTDFVKFSAYFAKDINEDGVAEKLLGACKRVNSTDKLYMDINVLTNGYLKDGVIAVNGTNFTYNMSMVKDDVLKNNYISDNVKTIELNQISAGTQKLILGDIVSNIGNNVNNYSSVSTITLTGIHVSDEGKETPIRKDINLNVDWYGTLEADLYTYGGSVYYNYEDIVNKDITDNGNETKQKNISINFGVDELNKELILKENVATVIIPELNGYAPIEVTCKNENVSAEYNTETKQLTIHKNAIVSESGIVEKGLPYSNTYTINITYPTEAYESVTQDTTIPVRVEGYYTAYNNQNEEFTNQLQSEKLFQSNTAKGEIEVVFKANKEEGYVYDFNVSLIDKTYNKRRNSFIISKQELLKLYESNKNNEGNKDNGGNIGNEISGNIEGNGIGGDIEGSEISEDIDGNANNNTMGDTNSNVNDETNKDNNAKIEYTVLWKAMRGATGEVSSVIMKETETEQTKATNIEGNKDTNVEEDKATNVNQSEKIYGDRFNQTIIQDYTSNKAVYFNGVEKALGEQGSLSIYNNDTNELIKTFTIEELKNYSEKLPYVYGQPVKHIRIETTNLAVESTLEVYNVKALDTNKIVEDFTKEEIEEIQILYTYLTGTANIVGENGEIEEGTVEDVDSAYYVSDKSYAEIRVEKAKMSTEGTLNNQKIYIQTIAEQIGDSEWRNGEFVVEIPEEIIGIQINNITIDNENVTVKAHEVIKVDGKYLVKIVTENELPQTYTITIDCNMTPRVGVGATPRVDVETNSINIRLYAHNAVCNDYYNDIEDMYDANGNGITQELVGTSETEIKLEVPTKLITYETVTDYNKNNETTYAPDVAEVEGTKIEENDGETTGKSDKGIAQINIGIINNYQNTINGVRILGKLPFNGNKYILNGQTLESEFTAVLEEHGIAIPQELEGKIDVYYSEYAEATKDLQDIQNGWKKLEDFESIQDIARVKSYLIDFKENDIPSKKVYTFSYQITVPETEDNNLISYSNHAVYYDIQTEEGRIELSTEPSKVGMKIVRKFNLEVKTFEKGENALIANTEYKLIWNEVDSNGNIKERSETIKSDAEGRIILENLYRGFEYKLQQITIDELYELNEEIVAFTINKEGSININGDTKNAEFVNNVLKIELENDKIKKYNLKINKVDEEGNLLDGAEFELQSTDDLPFIKENNNFNGLYQYVDGRARTAEYTLLETKAPIGYVLDNKPLKFKAKGDENGQLVLDIVTGDGLGNLSDEEYENQVSIDGDTIIVNIKNKKGKPVTITKIDEDTDEPIKDVIFDIYKINDDYETIEKAISGVKTDENGELKLYLNEGLYKAVEISAPAKYQFYENEDIRTTYFEVKNENYERADLEINTIEDLMAFSEKVNSGEDSFEGKTVRLMRNLDFNDNESYESENPDEMKIELTQDNGFTSIGKDEDNMFKGTFDGNGYSIKNVYIKKDTHAGFFGYILNASIKNLSIYGNYESSFGGIVNDAMFSNINNCCMYGRIKGGGGIVNLAYSSIVNNCYNYAEIENGAGGIVAYGKYGDSNNEIYNCGNFGTIMCALTGGGINCNGVYKIVNCYNNGKILSYYPAYGIGSSASEITNVVNVGDLRCKNAGSISYLRGIGRSRDIRNAYYLKGIAPKGSDDIDDADGIIEAKTKQELKSAEFIDKLNDNRKDIESEVKMEKWYVDKDGYPVLTRIFDSANITITNKQKEEFSINKVDEQGRPIEGVTFSVYPSEDYTYKNVSNNAVDTKVTNKDGKATFYLDEGYYKVVENNIPSGYISDENAITYIKIEKKEKADLEINDIETLIKFSEDVNSGKDSYKGKTVRLMRTLDFNQDTSYATSNRTEFKPIGTSRNPFKGTFDGNGNEIRNINIKTNNENAGLFGNISDAQILNLGITGEISAIKGYSGGFVGSIEGSIIRNCYNKANINGTMPTGGIVGQLHGPSTIINCYNEGRIESDARVGGIYGEYPYLTVCSSYNVGSLYGNVNDGIGMNTNNEYYEDVYYLKAAKLSNGGAGVEKNESEMKSPEFVDLLNGNKHADWVYVEGSYPKLIKYTNNVTIQNTKKTTYTITKRDNKTEEVLPGAEFKVETIDKIKTINEVDDITGYMFEEGTMKEVPLYKNYVYHSQSQTKNVDTFIPIDLSNYEGEKILLECEAGISSEENYDIGYAIITKSTDNPGYDNKEGRFIYISGEVENKKYYTELEGGSLYYLHMGYHKNDSNDVGDDLFTIRSATLNKCNELNTIRTDANGRIELSGLDSKKIRITETLAPEGYLLENYSKIIEPNSEELNITVTNKKLKEFTITKVDKEITQKPIANTKFAIYSTDEAYQTIDFAKDGNGKYLGDFDESNNIYTFTTNEQGKITVKLPDGYYKAVEVQAADGYVLEESEASRTTYFVVEEDDIKRKKIENADFVINSIEDLVKLSNDVYSGNSYEGKTVVLSKTLDFEDDNSYDDPTDTSISNYNGEIKTLLTDRNGQGFIPIGTSSTKAFKGTFDGNNHEIKNIYINRTGEGVGLFGCITNGKVSNLGLTGNGVINCNGSNGTGGIVGYINNAIIEKCYNSIEINGYACVGGIAGNSSGSTNRIVNCYNLGTITISSGAGKAGIIGNLNNGAIIDCYNAGNIDGILPSAGIAYNIADSKIVNCYNTGDITSNNAPADGIAFNVRNSKIINCYNTGNISASAAPACGILFDALHSEIVNCHNSGVIIGKQGAGGIAYNISSNSNIINSYNIGNINAESAPAGGIAFSISNGKIINCYNTGDITSNNAPAGGLAFSISNSEITNFYNAGIIRSGISILGGITYGSSSSSIGNCYYLNTSATQGIYNQNDVKGIVQAISESELKDNEFIKLLNNNKNNITSDVLLSDWISDDNEYPTLKQKAVIKANNVTITNKRINSGEFVITKLDEETNAPIPGTSFAIYSTDSSYKTIDFAKDENGKYIGHLLNSTYVVETDQNGKINLKLPDGYYKAVEILASYGYKLEENENLRTTYFKIGTDNSDADITINYIEDLIELSNGTLAGNTYEGKTIKLLRNLDFNDDASYRNPNDTRYGDYNGDETIEGIKAELTNEAGCGFKPIGTDSSQAFKGSFDGNRFEIRNIYINTKGEGGLFGYIVNGSVSNLGIVGGSIKASSNNGAIVGTISDNGNPSSDGGSIINCYNSANIYSRGYAIGGIAGRVLGKNIITNCYNIGNIDAGSYIAGGVIGIATPTNDISAINEIINCYNIGTIENIGRPSVGGVVGELAYGKVANCYNSGTLLGTSIGGITETNNNGKIINCYYLNNTAYKGICGQQDILGVTEARSELEMKSRKFAKVLNENINTVDDTIPLLEWQYDEDSYPRLIPIEFAKGNKAIITNQKLGQFTITKVDEETGETIPNTKFAIYSTDMKYQTIDFAKDGNGRYIGSLDNGIYVVKTNKNGEINLRLPKGYYKAVEIQSASGYILEGSETLRTIYFKIGDNLEIENADLVIYSIEDLVRFSEDVNSGKSHEGQVVVLARTLDFNDGDSYDNPNDESFGDYNGDGTTEGIKAELTNEAGCGFKPIGTSENPFNGTFDGNECEIKNIYINATNEGGLFGYAGKTTIINLGIVGGSISAKKDHGSIVGVLGQYDKSEFNEGGIINCYNTANVNANSQYSGGIVGRTHGKFTIINCYNKGNIYGNGYSVGGIIGYAIVDELGNEAQIVNCYNAGTIRGSIICVGGIAGLAKYIDNCYNIGNFIGMSTDSTGGGIVGGNLGHENITNCNSLETSVQFLYESSGSETIEIEKLDNEEGKIEIKTLEEMQSLVFSNRLNENTKTIESTIPLSSWQYNENSYPTLIPIQIIKGNEATITNRKTAQITVHHYKQGTGPEFGNDPVILAPDETTTGSEGEEYVTSPKDNIEHYTLAKDENGEDLIPENATGTYKPGNQDIYYYYTRDPLNVIVHHYLEGTETKVPLGTNEDGDEIVAEDEHYTYEEGEHYKVTPSEEVLKKYNKVKVVGNEEQGHITQDEEITYYYKIKEHEITTKVEIPDGRLEKGGQITGEGETPYETVKHEGSSVKEIVITPDPGYRVKQIIIVSTDESGNKTETMLYGKDPVDTAEIAYRPQLDGSITLTQFTNITEDKEIIVQFEPNEGKVIVHHYIENTEEKIHEDQIIKDVIGKLVETNSVEKEEYVVVEEPEEKNTTIKEEVQEKTYYYQKEYKITTDVIEHNENYKDGTVKKNIKGGSITDEDKDSHESVLKNRDSKEIIEITPDKDYEIVKITINDKDYNFKDTIDENGKVTLPEGFFENMQEDKHIEVEFRRKTRVIVKYLEEPEKQETEDGEEVEIDIEKAKVLAEKAIIKGYESQDFETAKKSIPNYQDSELGITDENVKTTSPNGTMYADEITIIYWYTRVPSGIIVRHIETNEKGEEIELESKLIDGSAGLKQPTARNKYNKYIPANAPENSNPDETIVTVMKKDEDSKTVTFQEDKVLEVWYYYEKQYEITTQVQPHEEKVLNQETGKIETKQVNGGTISKKYEQDENGNDKLDENGNKIETVFEKVLSRGDSKEKIDIKPDDGYKIKNVIKQKKVILNGKEVYEDEEIFIENIIKEDGSIILPEKYLTDVQNDYNIVVEFERIPAKVIVQYKDAYTKESIHEDKLVEGYVYDDYNEQRIEIDTYIPAKPELEPENNKGTMTEETITITYWYTKQFEITAEVKSHEEIAKNPETGEAIKDPQTGEVTKVQVNGGKIEIGENAETGENTGNAGNTGNTGTGNAGTDSTGTGNIGDAEGIEKEIVTRGENSKQVIKVTPDVGYRIKSLVINNKEYETKIVIINDKKYEIKDLIKDDGTLELPLFENMQEDKHIVVEFEKIPSKVIVEYLDEETNKSIVDNSVISGFVNDKYITEPQGIKYYKLVEEKYPENSKGVMKKEDIVVKYYYKKLKFNMKVEKEIQGIQLNGEEVQLNLENNKSAKLEVEYKDLTNIQIEIIYNIKVTNTEQIPGTAIIKEILPDGFEFVVDKSDANWKLATNAEFNKYNNITNEELSTTNKEYNDNNNNDDNDDNGNNNSNNGNNNNNNGNNNNDNNNNVDNGNNEYNSNTTYMNGKEYMLFTNELKPGETREYRVTLKWIAQKENKGEKINTAKIAQAINEPGYEETILQDNEDRATVEIKVNKTVDDIIDDAKNEINNGNIGGAISGVVGDVIENVQTGDIVVVYVIILVISVGLIGVTIVVRRRACKGKN